MTELLYNAWAFIGPAQELLLAVLITILGTLILWVFHARVNLVWGSTSSNLHEFRMDPDQDKVSISTEKYYVQNTGRKPANSVELVFSAVPTSYNIWAQRDHSVKALENGSFVLTIPSLAPKELLIVDMLDVRRGNPRLLAVNCPDVLATHVAFQVARKFGNMVNLLIAYLMLTGLIGTVYLLLQLAFGE